MSQPLVPPKSFPNQSGTYNSNKIKKDNSKESEEKKKYESSEEINSLGQNMLNSEKDEKIDELAKQNTEYNKEDEKKSESNKKTIGSIDVPSDKIYDSSSKTKKKDSTSKRLEKSLVSNEKKNDLSSKNKIKNEKIKIKQNSSSQINRIKKLFKIIKIQKKSRIIKKIPISQNPQGFENLLITDNNRLLMNFDSTTSESNVYTLPINIQCFQEITNFVNFIPNIIYSPEEILNLDDLAYIANILTNKDRYNNRINSEDVIMGFNQTYFTSLKRTNDNTI